MKAATRTQTLTTKDIEHGYTDERWLGWGYLGDRQHGNVPAARIRRADKMVLDAANAAGFDYEALFDWMNSRDGRHFADGALGWPQPAPWAATLLPRSAR